MSYFLRNVLRDDASTPGSQSPNNVLPKSKISTDYGNLLRNCVQLPAKGHLLKLPTARETYLDNVEAGEAIDKRLPKTAFDLDKTLQVVAGPSSFATVAIARAIVLRYGHVLEESEKRPSTPEVNNFDDLGKEGNTEDRPCGAQIVSIGMNCMFSVLWELSRRDSELCVQALTSLLNILQNLPPEALHNEPKQALKDMHNMLKRLRLEGSSSVSSLASSCLSALSIACATPEFLFSTAASFLCDNVIRTTSASTSSDLVQIPDNQHRLAMFVQHRVYHGADGSGDWWSNNLSEHHVLCSFDMSQLPVDSSPETPDDDKRLCAAIACDGVYVYVLNYLGLYKMGTGMNETIVGKLYASNTMMKASRNCVLSFCNSSLYLRRGQSSRVWVLDVDTLREIGEIILPTGCTQCAIFSDGTSFYQANVDSHSTLVVAPMDDSFVASTDSKAKQRFRLTEVAYASFGDIEPVPHQLPYTLPNSLHNQAADLHMGRDVAFLLARSGKVYYAGNGAKLGLQETGTTWMEFVLPEPIVQICVGSENVLFRSGGGHVWMAGGDDRKRVGKLRRLQTANKRKAISIAASAACFAYVTENGRAYACGRHAMRTHPETGLVAGLEGVHLVSIFLGKTHAVAITRHGHLYTWGLNNLNQCGRVEASSTTSSPFNTPKQTTNKASDTPQPVCSLNEHLWVKDVSSICVSCGKCSARGSACIRASSAQPGGLCPCGPGETACLRCGVCRACGEMAPAEVMTEAEDAPGTPHKIMLGPARIILLKSPVDVKVAMVACGNFHTICLAADRSVFTLGSNCHGQLGVGDTKKRVGPQKVELPSGVQIVQVAAGANHCVLRSSDGQVFTFGAHKQGQLARDPTDPLWHCRPQPVSGFGQSTGVLATWIGAEGDVTLIHSHKTLFTNENIVDSQIVANKNALFVFPRQIGKDYVVVKRKQNSFTHHQLGPAGLYTAWCLEQSHNVTWAYSAAEMRVQALTDAKEMRDLKCEDPISDLSFLRCAEFCVPTESESRLSASQMAINILSSTYALTMITANPTVAQKESNSMVRCDSSGGLSDGYSVVNRFEGNGGGWGYSAHSVEAIQFKTNKDIRLLGVGLYGGRGEYIAKIKIFRLLGGDLDELYVEQLTETDETLFECGARETAALMLARPVVVQAGQWHVVSAKISGPSSDCGASGRALVENDDVTFTFRNSVISNNGTDINVGQLPELYYQVDKTESDKGEDTQNSKEQETKLHAEMAVLLRSRSVITPTPDVFTSLLRIFDWGVTRVFEKNGELHADERQWNKERAAIVAILSIRMMSFYTRFLYSPSSAVNEEPSTEMAECVSRISVVLNTLFELANEHMEAEDQTQASLLDECISLYTAIAHCLLVSRTLVLSRLAQGMASPNKDWALTALLRSLNCMSPILPMLVAGPEGEKENCQFPILAEKLSLLGSKNVEKVRTMTSFQNILRFFFDCAFGGNVEMMTVSKYCLAEIAQDLIVRIVKEVVTPDISSSTTPTLIQSPPRFRRRSAHANWDLSSGAPDALCIRTDVAGLTIHGIGLYAGNSQEMNIYCEVLVNKSDGGEDEWLSIEKTHTTIQATDDTKESVVLRFTKGVRIQPGTVYAIKVNAQGGGKTFCGEGGINYIRLCNGVRLVFNNCSLSENGTSLTRGQIPFLIYSMDDLHKQTSTVKADPEQGAKWFMCVMRLLSTKISEALANGVVPPAARRLVSRLAGHIMVFLEGSPHKALEVVATIDQLLPMVSSVNAASKTASNTSSPSSPSLDNSERKSIQTVVECPHPYKANYVHSLVVGFDKDVEFVSVSFSEECQTSQADDQLWIYIGVDRECYVPVAKFCGSKGWPTRHILLPGNSLWFVLETSSQIEGITEDQIYGFRCTVNGYPAMDRDSNLVLEQELVWISANACRLLVELPSDPESLSQMMIAEEETRDLMEKHGQLLRKGLNLAHTPTVHELLTRSMPPPALTSDLRFLREFISGSPSTVSGLLARWLPLGSVVDIANCQLVMGDEQLSVGSRNSIKLIPRDQFGRVAQCSQLTVEVTVRMGGTCDSQKGEAFKGIEQLPSLQTMIQNTFQPVYMNKARYMSICMMPAFSNYSYEELRLGFFRDAIVKDTVTMEQKNPSTFVGDWIPRQAGTFRVECRIDGFQLPQSYTVEVVEAVDVKDGKKGKSRVAQLSRAQLGTVPGCAAYQAVRIRNSPTLSATVIGYLPRGANLSYIEELENPDGRWLRLTDETSALHTETQFPSQAWCLQFHRQLRRELISLGTKNEKSPREEFPSRLSDEVNRSLERMGNEQSVLIETREMYILSDGDRVELYSKPSLESVINGEHLEGRRELLTDGWIHNSQGVWIRLANSHRYILAEDQVGRSSVHSQLQSTNGNEDEDGALPVRQLRPRSSAQVRAIRPSVVDCCRTVFAAFLHHEHLVKDAMAAAAYLKFHTHLHNLWPTCEAAPVAMAPAPLQPLVRLWKDVCHAVQTSIEQHLIMPSPPGVRQFRTPSNYESQIQESGELCELCEERIKVPITVHMRMTHPGCAKACQGHGFNSSGKYTSGWAGHCGDGGRAGSTWYLMCPSCRGRYLKQTPSGHQQERNRRWREFRLSSAAFDSRPENVLKQNATFLLELNSSVEGADGSKNSSTNTSGWTINMFPGTNAHTPTVYRSTHGRDLRDKLTTTSHQMRRDSDTLLGPSAHTSDPGPKASSSSRTESVLEERAQLTNEVLQSPSAALKSLVSISSSCSPGPSSMLRRPVMAFVIEHHDLKRVREASVQAVKRAVGFSHAFKVWNWLLRLVSSETSVSDVVLQYLSALSSYSSLVDPSTRAPVRLLPHPWRLCFLAGPIAVKMVQQLHAFLYTIAIILQSSGVDPGLRSLCFKAWTIQLTAHEQDLIILTCNILASVGGVLSDTSGDQYWMEDSDSIQKVADTTKTNPDDDRVDVKHMNDVTSGVRIEASSRQAMVVCLSDGSGETFWESGDEDKSRSRLLTVSCDSESVSPVLLCLYVDNIRDEQFKTSHVSVRAIMPDGSRKNLHSLTLDQQFVGWLKCCVAGVSHVQIVLKGPNPAQRIRQLCVFGFFGESPSSPSREVIRPSVSHQLLFSATQTDAFALFQAISAQAFSDELAEEQHGTLRQRVIELLFSRVQLQPLQTYVCTQIANALDREVITLRDRSKRNYSYACGLMNILTRICASRRGTEVFAARNYLLITLSELLLFSPQVVQCQVIETIEKLLPVFTPSQVDCARFVGNLLVSVAKVISLQVREKATHTVTQANITTCVSDAPSYWRTDKTVSPEIGKLVMNFIEEVCNSTFSADWGLAFRRELATVLLGVLKVSGGDFGSVNSSTAIRSTVSMSAMCNILASRRFWLSVAALSIIKEKQWLELADGWNSIQAARQDEPEAMCENHDDGKTLAQVFCEVCKCALCRDCFTILHLNKKNRSHDVQIIGNASTAPQVDIHDGCSRLRLPNMLVLFHGSTLNGLVELSPDALFPSASSVNHRHSNVPIQSARCRFCTNQLVGDKQQLDGICAHEECVKLSLLACTRQLQCAHRCNGIADEKECLTCLQCPSSGNGQDSDDVCVICFTDRLGAAPCVRLTCGHVFHYLCVRTVLEKRWNGPRIQFRFICCPLCNIEIDHPGLRDLLNPLRELQNDVIQKAKMRLEYDGLLGCAALTSETSEFFGQPEAYAMSRYMYVLCHKCKRAYFGGESRCQLALDSSQYNPDELICGGCSDVSGAQVCGRHGVEYLEYKCRFCCSIAVYFCFGTTHFCAPCHDDFQRLMCLPKNLLPKCPAGPRGSQLEEGPCPLRLQHPPTGEEFAMGCGICRNLSTF